MNNGLHNISRPVPEGIAAWVVFNGANGAIIESYRIKSVVRTATGIYDIELDFAMPSIYWPWGASCRRDVGAANFGFVTGQDADATTSSITIRTIGVTVAPAVAAYDPDEVTFFVIGANQT